MKSLSDRIIEIRNDNNMTQKQFAIVIGVNESYISKIENNKKYPSGRLIKTICSNFMLNEKWLETGEGNKHKKLSDIKSVSLEKLQNFVKYFDNKVDLVNKKSISNETEKQTIEKKPSPLTTKQDQWYLKAVKDIFRSGQIGIIDALKSNIREFYEAIENKKRLLEIEGKKNGEI